MKVRATAFLVLVLASMTLWPALGSAQTDYPSSGSASFSDPTPGPGEGVTISGQTSAFTLVTVSMTTTEGAQVLGTAMSDGAGNYSLVVTVPAGTTGSVVLSVTASGQVLASTSYSIASPRGNGSNSTQGPSGSGSLPLTGANTPLVALVALVLLAAGVTLTVASHRTY